MPLDTAARASRARATIAAKGSPVTVQTPVLDAEGVQTDTTEQTVQAVQQWERDRFLPESSTRQRRRKYLLAGVDDAGAVVVLTPDSRIVDGTQKLPVVDPNPVAPTPSGQAIIWEPECAVQRSALSL